MTGRDPGSEPEWQAFKAQVFSVLRVVVIVGIGLLIVAWGIQTVR